MKKQEFNESELLSNQVKLLSGMLIRMKENEVKECFLRVGITPSCPVEKKEQHSLREKLYS